MLNAGSFCSSEKGNCSNTFTPFEVVIPPVDPKIALRSVVAFRVDFFGGKGAQGFLVPNAPTIALYLGDPRCKSDTRAHCSGKGGGSCMRALCAQALLQHILLHNQKSRRKLSIHVPTNLGGASTRGFPPD